MSKIRICQLIVTMLVAERTLGQEATNAALPTLLEVVELARSNSHEARAAEYSAQAQSHAAESVRLKKFPKLRFESAHGPAGVIPKTASDIGSPQDVDFASSFSIGSSWVLFDRGEQAHEEKTADNQAEIAQLRSMLAVQDLSRQVAKQYFQLQSAMAMGALNDRVEAILKTQFTMAERQFRQGLKPQKDFQKISAELKRSQVEKESRARQLANQQMQLARLAGVDPARFQARAQFAPRLPGSSREIFDARSMVGDIAETWTRIDQLTLESARESAERTQSKRFVPEIQFSVNGQYGASQYIGTSQSITDRDQFRWSALMSVNMDLWDWGVLRSRSQAEWSKFSALQSTIEDEKTDRALQYELVKANLQDQLSQFDLLTELNAMEERSFRNLEIDYRQGKVSYIELISAIRDLTSSRRQLFEAYFSIQSQLIDLNYYEGKLDEWIKAR
jgi:outer membrane protein TolC